MGDPDPRTFLLLSMPKTCIIIPCYNEEQRLPKSAFLKFLEDQPDVMFCFVDDGSRDRTGEMLRELAAQGQGRILILALEKNGGKAEAVRRGILQALELADVGTVGYFDADLSTPLSEIIFLSREMSAGGFCMAMGCRIKRLGASIDRKGARHYLGRIFSTTASLLLQLPVYDTQCGAKIFTRELAGRIFQQPFLSRWFFDVEILFRVGDVHGAENIPRLVLEVPLHCWQAKADSKINFLDYFQAPFELVRIWRAYRRPGSRQDHSCPENAKDLQ